MKFFMHTRRLYRIESRNTLQDAINAGAGYKEPFDVLDSRGVAVWVWEMRP